MTNQTFLNTDALRQLRRQHHFTQSFLADYLYISRQCYSQYERGERIPDLPILIGLASLYHVSLCHFILPSFCSIISPACYQELFLLGLDCSTPEFLYLSASEVDFLMLLRTADYDVRQTLLVALCDQLTDGLSNPVFQRKEGI